MVFDFDIDKAPKTKEFLKELTSFMETLNTPKFIKLQNNKNFDEIENILSKKYQDLLGKIGKLNNLNNNEIKATSEVENITVNEEPNNIEDIYKDRKKEIETNSKKIEEDQNKEDRPKGGRHF